MATGRGFMICDECGEHGPLYDSSFTHSCRGDCGADLCESCAVAWYDDADDGHRPTCLCAACATGGAA